MAKRLAIDQNVLERYLQNMNSSGKISVTIDHREEIIYFKKFQTTASENQKALAKFCTMLEYINDLSGKCS